jgi:hypothetical protein
MVPRRVFILSRLRFWFGAAKERKEHKDDLRPLCDVQRLLSRIHFTACGATTRFRPMSSLKEIESAIRALSPDDRARLVKDLPALLPEWEGDLAWARILNDPTPSQALSAFVDEVDAQYRQNPEAFPEIRESDFDRSS